MALTGPLLSHPTAIAARLVGVLRVVLLQPAGSDASPGSKPAIGAALRPGFDFTAAPDQLQRSCEAACSTIEADQRPGGSGNEPCRVRTPSLAQPGSARHQLLDENATVVLACRCFPAQDQACDRGLGGVLGPLQTSGTDVNTIGPGWAGGQLSTPACSWWGSSRIRPLTISFRYSALRLLALCSASPHDRANPTGSVRLAGIASVGLRSDSLFAVAC